MQFQRQIVRIPEEGHLFAGEGVQPDGFAGDAQLFQLPNGILHAVHPEGQMAQAAGLGMGDAPGRIWGREDFQLDLRSQGQIQLPVGFVRALVFADHPEAQLVHIEIPGNGVIGHDDGHVVDGVELHRRPPFTASAA